MKKTPRYTMLAAIMIAIAVLFFCSQEAWAASGLLPDNCILPLGKVERNIRSKASMEGKIIGKLPLDAAAFVQDSVEKSDGTWYLIKSGNISGYVLAGDNYAEGEAAERMAFRNGRVAGETREDVYLRAEASRSSAALDLLPEGESLRVLWVEEGFLRVRTGSGSEGYVKADYVDTWTEFSRAYAYEEASDGSAKSSGSSAKFEPVYDWFRDEYAVPSVAGKLNIRKKPSLDSKIVGRITSNSMAAVDDVVKNDEGTWLKLHSGDVEGYAMARYFIRGEEAARWSLNNKKVKALVLADRLNVRKKPDAESTVIATVKEEEYYTVVSIGTEFTKIEVSSGVYGYVKNDYIKTGLRYGRAIGTDLVPSEPLEKKDVMHYDDNTELRKAIVRYAKRFETRLPYIWGGTSLIGGSDCSGFVQAVYRRFGISLPRLSYEQGECGKKISLDDIRIGDLIHYDGHMAIYIGDGKVISARGKNYGIQISSMYYRDDILSIRNVID